MKAEDVKELIDKSIILFDEEHERFPGIIESFDLEKEAGDKPYKMYASIGETQTGKGKVLVKWKFVVSESDIKNLKNRKEVTLTRKAKVRDMELSIVYHGIIVS